MVVLAGWAWPLTIGCVCSTYYGFCGNAAAQEEGSTGPGGDFRAAICQKWLHPLGMSPHPLFAQWLIYGLIPALLCSAQHTPPTCGMHSTGILPFSTILTFLGAHEHHLNDPGGI